MAHAPSEAIALGELLPLEIYLVGGAVRDGLLGLPVGERDWVVVGAREEEMLGHGFRRADADFPVFLHPLSGEEYALARSERKTGEGYRGFTLDYAPEITLEQDLARRDLTINAMAQDAEGRIIDPFKGREDLERGRLRHLTPAFSEDPVRLLRIARFAARLGGLGFRVAHSTQPLLQGMVSSGELLNLTRERIWRETSGALADDQPWRYFEVLESCGALAVLMPEIHAALGRSGQHGGASPALDVLMRLTRRSPDPALRFGAWLASILPAQRLAGWCDEQRTGKAVRELTLRLGECLALADPLAAGDPDAWAWLLKGWDAKVHPALPEGYMVALAALQPRLAAQIEPQLPWVREAWEGVSGAALRAEGFVGGELGRELARRRWAAIIQVFDERGRCSQQRACEPCHPQQE